MAAKNLRLILPFFLVIFAYARCSSSLNYTKYKQVSSLRLVRIQRHLDKINKPPVITIQSPDGDIIDCVHKRKQLALDHPLLKNHKIQKVPPEIPKSIKIDEVNEDENMSTNCVDGLRGVWQMWHQNGQRCPKGTIPIRRSAVNEVLRAKSFYDFGKKHPNYMPKMRDDDAPDVVIRRNGHEHAVAYTSEELYGTKATMNVWQPSIEVVGEFSLAQIWVLSGSFDSDLNSIEAGWQVSPELYGDSRPRLFTYWTSDAYQATGCYNLLCSGFVQTNSRIAIGAAISPVSLLDGNQYDITILIWKDPKSGNWWMAFGDNTLVGYWPSELFSHLSDRATMVEWGGEIINSRANNEHTATQMGSGEFAEGGFSKSSYFRNLEVVNSVNSLRLAHDLQTLAENENCYNINSSYSNEWGTYFYYGGPGKNIRCP